MQESSSVVSRKKQLINLAVIAIFACATLFFLLKDNNLLRLADIIKNADKRFLWMGVAVIAVFFFVEAISIRALLKSFGYKPSVMRCYGYSFVDFYFSSITPGCAGGQPAQIYYMNRDQIPPGSSSMAILLFNLAYHISVLLIALVAFLNGAMKAVLKFSVLKILIIYGAAIQILLVIAFIGLAFSPRLVPNLISKIIHLLKKIRIVKNEEKWQEKARIQMQEYRSCAEHIRKRPLLLLQTLALTTLHLLLLYSISYFVYRALGLSELGLFAMIGIQATMTLAIESLPIPGAFGAAEASFLAVYGSIFGGGLVLVALLLARGLNYYLGLIVGAVISFVMHRKRTRTPLTKAFHLRKAAKQVSG